MGLFPYTTGFAIVFSASTNNSNNGFLISGASIKINILLVANAINNQIAYVYTISNYIFNFTYGNGFNNISTSSILNIDHSLFDSSSSGHCFYPIIRIDLLVSTNNQAYVNYIYNSDNQISEIIFDNSQLYYNITCFGLCFGNRFIQNNSCVLCGSATQFCVECTSSGLCTACQTGYIVNKYY